MNILVEGNPQHINMSLRCGQEANGLGGWGGDSKEPRSAVPPTVIKDGFY